MVEVMTEANDSINNHYTIQKTGLVAAPGV